MELAAAEARSGLLLERAAILYGLIVPFDSITALRGLGLSATPFATLLLLVAWFSDRGASGTNPRRTWPLVLLGSFLVWCLTTFFWTRDVGSSLITLVQLGMGSLTFAALSTLAHGSLRRVMPALSLSSAGVSALVMVFGVADPWSGRLSLAGADSNYLAFAMLLGMSAACAMVVVWPTWKLPWVASSIPLISAGIISTGSRTGFVALVLLLSVSVVWLIADGRRRPASTLGVMVFMAAAAVWIQGAVASSERITTFLDNPLASDDSGRSAILLEWWSIASDWWMEGVGVGAQVSMLNRGGPGQVAHDAFIGIWIETGLLGLLLFSAFWISVIIAGIFGALPRFAAVWLIPAGVFSVAISAVDINGVWMCAGLVVASSAGRAAGEVTRPIRRAPHSTRRDDSRSPRTRGAQRVMRARRAQRPDGVLSIRAGLGSVGR